MSFRFQPSGLTLPEKIVSTAIFAGTFVTLGFAMLQGVEGAEAQDRAHQLSAEGHVAAATEQRIIADQSMNEMRNTMYEAAFYGILGSLAARRRPDFGSAS